MNHSKVFIGPMSKNVVDSIIEFSTKNSFGIGFIPSRRQVEYDGGYVNGWTTEYFSEYVKSKSFPYPVCRDHGGEYQGKIIDDGKRSYIEDCKYLDLIHIDPFRVCDNIEQAAVKTKNSIEEIWKNNSNVYYEVGTEEAIFKYSPDDLDWFLNYLKTNLKEEKFLKIKYAVIQSGTRLNLYERKNTGIFDKDRCTNFISVVKKYNLLSKEHNGDYLIDENAVEKRFEMGLDAINIAPEFGQIESEYYLEKCSKNKKLLSELYKICYDSGKWKKWIANENEVSKKQLIITCCHYVLSDDRFLNAIKTNFPDSDFEIKQKINLKLNLLYEQTKNYCI